jgi:hypothetical protein
MIGGHGLKAKAEGGVFRPPPVGLCNPGQPARQGADRQSKRRAISVAFLSGQRCPASNQL